MKDFAKRFSACIDTVNISVAKVVMWMVPVSIGIISLDIGARFFFKYSIIWAFDISWMLFAFYVMPAASYTLLDKGHVRVDLLFSLLPEKARNVIDLVFYLIFFIPLLLCIIISGTGWALESIINQEHWTMGPWLPPIYHIKALIPATFFLFLVQVVSEMIKCIKALVRKSDEEVKKW